MLFLIETSKTLIKKLRIKLPDEFLKKWILSSNKEAMTEFGIKDTNQFELLDSVGGRYSIWSSMSLPAIVEMGWDGFKELLL